MSKNGKNNGGGDGSSAKEVRDMQDRYAEARIAGNGKDAAKAIAGYAPTGTDIEKPGSQCSARIRMALQKKGIDEDSLAGEYAAGISLAKQEGSRDQNLMAHVQYLKSICYLLGYGRKETPTVAVQINNNPSLSQDLAAGEIAELTRLLREEISGRDAGGVHEADVIDGDSKPHPGVGKPASDVRQAGGGGGARSW